MQIFLAGIKIFEITNPHQRYLYFDVVVGLA
jgi:hypothetical protein